MVTVLFTGCEKPKKIEPKTVFQADFTLLYNEMQIKGEVKSNEDKSVEIEVDSPESLNGLKISSKNDEFEVGYKGINKSYAKDDLPDSAFFKLLIFSLEQIIDLNSLEFEKVDGKYQATKNSPLGDIKITLDDNSYIEQIEIPKQSFNLKLKVKNPS